MADGWTPERSAAGKRNPWLIVSIISMATFMEVLDASIANVALTHIAGGLSVSPDEATWVLTSYLIANAIIIPISGWLADMIGRKHYYQISVALFGVSSLLCGLAPNLTTLIIARILQGIGGGGLAPSEQSILADTFPPKKRGMAFAAYGFVIVVGPVLGPTIGGFITDNINWHWIFLINVPISIVSLLLVQTFVCEPEILRKERKERLKHGPKMDYIGFALIVLGLGLLEFTLDRGQREDWFESGMIVTTAIISALSLVALVAWELWRKDPIVNLRLFKNRNFALSTIFIAIGGLIIFGSTALIPQLLQQVFDYSASDAGLAITAGGFVTVVMMPFVGILTGRVDTRYLLFGALVVQGLALWNLSLFSPDIAFGDVAMGRLWQSIALPFLFVPVNATAYVGLEPHETNEASALLNVSRNMGGTIGISIAQALLIQRQQFHQSRMVETLSPLNPDYNQAIDTYSQALGSGSDMSGGLGALYREVGRQATMFAYVDVFHVLMIFVLCIAPLALFLRKAKSGKTAAAH